MKREVRDNTKNRYPKPVIKAELSDKNIKLRIIIIILLIIVAGVFIGLGISSCLGTEKGWAEIEVTYEENNNASDFIFNYELGTTDLSPTKEKNQIASIYTNAIIKAYQLYDEYTEYQTLKNIYYINHHINEEIEVDELLYQTLEKLKDNRYIYQSMIYDQYFNLFNSSSDDDALEFDPLKNEEMGIYFKEILSYTNDENHINLELLQNNKIRLNVSKEYQEYNEGKTYIALSFFKNACIIDYIASELINAGYTNGYITSIDGYIRNLDKRGNEYTMTVSDKEKNIHSAFSFDYQESSSIVYLKNYALSDNNIYYYEYEDGTRVSQFISLDDGVSYSSTSNLVCISTTSTCLDILLQMLPLYINNSIDQEKINSLKDNNIYTMYIDKKIIIYNNDVEIKYVYDGYEVMYVKD